MCPPYLASWVNGISGAGGCYEWFSFDSEGFAKTDSDVSEANLQLGTGTILLEGSGPTPTVNLRRDERRSRLAAVCGRRLGRCRR